MSASAKASVELSRVLCAEAQNLISICRAAKEHVRAPHRREVEISREACAGRRAALPDWRYPRD